jgi:hypothetical protein
MLPHRQPEQLAICVLRVVLQVRGIIQELKVTWPGEEAGRSCSAGMGTTHD